MLVPQPPPPPPNMLSQWFAHVGPFLKNPPSWFAGVAGAFVGFATAPITEQAKRRRRLRLMRKRIYEDVARAYVNICVMEHVSQKLDKAYYFKDIGNDLPEEEQARMLEERGRKEEKYLRPHLTFLAMTIDVERHKKILRLHPDLIFELDEYPYIEEIYKRVRRVQREGGDEPNVSRLLFTTEEDISNLRIKLLRKSLRSLGPHPEVELALRRLKGKKDRYGFFSRMFLKAFFRKLSRKHLSDPKNLLGPLLTKEEIEQSVTNNHRKYD